MTPLNRALVGSLLILAWPTAHAADGQKVFTQGGANPAAMACLGCHGPDGKGIAAAGGAVHYNAVECFLCLPQKLFYAGV